MNLGFIILAHNQPTAIRRLTDILASEGNRVVIHFDTSASAADKQAVRQLAEEHPDRIQVISKVHCVWGEWSLVEAVLLALREFAKMPDPPDYIHLMSGADFPIRPIDDLKEFLRRSPNLDFVECCDITQRPWVKGGLGRERLRFFFPFNFRTSRESFDRLVRWQRKLKIRRRMPLNLAPHMGSQWWTLRWSTCRKVLDLIAKHPKVPRFFRSTWIPDESFFQTVIAKVVPKSEIADLQLMFHHLGPSGRPYVFYNDHLPVIRKLPHFFIRKVSPAAVELFKNPVSRPDRPIPRQRHLVRARDLVRARIDANHLFEGSVPGRWEPISDPKWEPRIATETRPLILYLIADRNHVQLLETIIRANLAFYWLGRPFAPKSIEMPEDPLIRTGHTGQSWKLRDGFIHEFIQLLVSTPPDSRIPAAALVVGEDQAHLPAIGLLPGLLPVFVSDQPLKPHAISQLAGILHAASPALQARALHLTLNEIPALLEDFLTAPPLSGSAAGGS
ncbi:MAG: beta-1,6-N-acetylglucosaminyltransferase [Akkermansiaceae bacterium]